MQPIQKEQLRTIYGTARGAGIDNDNLHTLTAALTGKASLRELSYAEAVTVIADLRKRQGKSHPPRSKKVHEEIRGGVTSEQQTKAWALMYQLQKFDPSKGNATLGDRLCGVIKKQYGMDAHPAQPFRFLSMAQGGQLIETLKQMATKAELKALHKGGTHHG